MDETRPIEPPTRGAGFPQTQWSVVLRARDGTGTQLHRSAMELLCRAYWQPLYAFARRQGSAPPDAQDLVQGFFLYLLEKGLFGAADPAKGRLRTFLLTAFTRFISRERHRAGALKRGGGQRLVSLDQEYDDGETRYRREVADQSPPEDVFARTWASTLLAAAKAQLLAEETTAGRQAAFPIFEVFLERERAPGITYESAAPSLGLSPEAMRKAVSRLRERYRQAVRAQVAETLEHPSEKEIDAELRFLRAALG